MDFNSLIKYQENRRRDRDIQSARFTGISPNCHLKSDEQIIWEKGPIYLFSSNKKYINNKLIYSFAV